MQRENDKARQRMMRRPGKLIYAMNRMAERLMAQRKGKAQEDVDMNEE